MTLKSDAKFEEKLICCFKNDKVLINLELSTQILKFSTLIGFFLCKVYKFDLQEYRVVIFLETEDWCKICRKTDLLFQKWQEFSEFCS